MHFTHFSNVKVYSLIILDVRGILVIYEVSRIDNSFLPFRGYFGHFWIYRVILVILEHLRLFLWIKRFSGGLCFWTFCTFGAFWWFWEYNSHSSDFYDIFFVKKNYFTYKSHQNIKEPINIPEPLKWTP